MKRWAPPGFPASQPCSESLLYLCCLYDGKEKRTLVRTPCPMDYLPINFFLLETGLKLFLLRHLMAGFPMTLAFLPASYRQLLGFPPPVLSVSLGPSAQLHLLHTPSLLILLQDLWLILYVLLILKEMVYMRCRWGCLLPYGPTTKLFRTPPQKEEKAWQAQR